MEATRSCLRVISGYNFKLCFERNDAILVHRFQGMSVDDFLQGDFMEEDGSDVSANYASVLGAH